ncbi:histidinol-phosphate transaminase [Virgibacillus flavescens]|uniref:histidinol-phosphate transaminase n=1 Tax=Virgibacillus flavescens TaxID=1611422 RepID=UPI003D350608
MKWKEQIRTMKAYQPGKSIDEVMEQYQLDSIVKLASNENPYGHSSKVNAALKDFQSSFLFYPDGSASALREQTADFLDVESEQLIFSNGTDELMQTIARALLRPGKNTVMATPTFPQYKHISTIEGAEVREVELVEGCHNLHKMLAEINKDTAIVWLCSPNNPTGTYIPEDELLAFMAKVPNDVMVVLDEAYYEYVQNAFDSLSLIDTFSNLIILRTFSKIYGLAGFRVGYGVSATENIRALEPLRLPFNTNVLGQLAATAALSDQEFIEDCRRWNAVEKEKFYSFCEQNDLHYFPSEGNFILIDFRIDGDELAEHLLSNGLIVRSGKQLGFPTSLRITIGLSEQNERVRNVLTEFIKLNTLHTPSHH